MIIDLHAKGVLTVISAALVAIVVQNGVSTAMGAGWQDYEGRNLCPRYPVHKRLAAA